MRKHLVIFFVFVTSLVLAAALLGSTGTAYYDFLKVTGLSNPFTGHAQLSVDSTTNRLTCINSDGSSCNPISNGGTVWAALTYNSGWSDYGSPYQVGQYGIDNSGRIWLRGALIPGTASSGTVIATLPSGARPASQQAFYTSCNVGASIVQIDVHTDGTVVLQTGSGGSCSTSMALDYSFTTN